MLCCTCTGCKYGPTLSLLGLVFSSLSLISAVQTFGDYAIISVYSDNGADDSFFEPLEVATVSLHFLGAVLNITSLIIWCIFTCGSHYHHRKLLNKLNLTLNVTTTTCWCMEAIFMNVLLVVYSLHSFTKNYAVFSWLTCFLYCGSLSFAIAVFCCVDRSDDSCQLCKNDETRKQSTKTSTTKFSLFITTISDERVTIDRNQEEVKFDDDSSMDQLTENELAGHFSARYGQNDRNSLRGSSHFSSVKSNISTIIENRKIEIEGKIESESEFSASTVETMNDVGTEA